jgi:hypothetical protein
MNFIFLFDEYNRIKVNIFFKLYDKISYLITNFV